MPPVHKVKSKKGKRKLSPYEKHLVRTLDSAKKIPKSKCSVVIFKPHENPLASILTQYLNRVGINTGKRHEMYKQSMQNRIQNHRKKVRRSNDCVKATKIQKGSTEIVPLTEGNMQQFLCPQMSNSVMLWRPRSPQPKPGRLGIPPGRPQSTTSLRSTKSSTGRKVSRAASVPCRSYGSLTPSIGSFFSLRSRPGDKMYRRNSGTSWEKIVAKHSYGSVKSQISKSSQISERKKKKLKVKKKKSKTLLKRNLFNDLIDKQARDVIDMFLKKCMEFRKADIPVDDVTDSDSSTEEEDNDAIQQRREQRIAERQARMDLMDPVEEVDEECNTEEKDKKSTCRMAREPNDSHFVPGEECVSKDSMHSPYASWGTDTKESMQEEQEVNSGRSHISRSREKRSVPGKKDKLDFEAYIHALEGISRSVERNASTSTSRETPEFTSIVQSGEVSKHIREPKDFNSQKVTDVNRRTRVTDFETSENAINDYTIITRETHQTASENQRQKSYQKHSKQRIIRSESNSKAISVAVENNSCKKNDIFKFGNITVTELTPLPDIPAERVDVTAQEEPIILEEQSVYKRPRELKSTKLASGKQLQESGKKNTHDAEKRTPTYKLDVHEHQSMDLARPYKKTAKSRKTNEVAPTSILKTTSHSLEDVESIIQSERKKDEKALLITPDLEAGDTILNRKTIVPSALSTEIMASEVAETSIENSNLLTLGIDGASYSAVPSPEEHKASTSRDRTHSQTKRHDEEKKHENYVSALRKEITKYITCVKEKRRDSSGLEVQDYSDEIIYYPDSSGNKKTRKKVSQLR